MTVAREQLLSQVKECYLEEGGFDYWEALQCLQRELGYTMIEAQELINTWEKDRDE